MIIPLAALLLLLSPALLGGRLRRLAEIRLHHAVVITLALAVQIVIVELLPGPRWLLAGAHVATYLAAAAFLWLNRRIPGLLMVGLGGACNGITIALNGGTLPATADAMRRSGIPDSAGQFVNSGVLSHPRLAFLGDIFAIPASWPLSNVFSVGDVIIVLGVGYASIRICGLRWVTPWNAAAAHHAGPRHLATSRSPRIPAPRDAAGCETRIEGSGTKREDKRVRR